MASSGSGGRRSGPPPRPGKPTAAKSRPAKPAKTRMPAGVHMPAEGEPGTLTEMLRNNRIRRVPDSDGDESQPSSPQTPVAPPSPPPGPRSTAAVVAAADGAPSTAVLLRKFHSYAQYHCDDLYVSEAMKVYKSAKKDEKHEILRRFADDKPCKWVVTMNERNIQQQITGSDFTEGEMAEWEIADLNKLPRDHPNYRVLLDGLLAGLPCREHPIEAWRPHTKLYTYSHEGHLVHHRRETEERTLEASKDLGKSKQITVVVKKEHVVLKSLQQEIKNVKTWEKKLTTALRDGKKIVRN